ncbi:multicopper oxidase family protein [Dactylosporangium sp. McL0621]|uniref:multicopper oxidase family protein n=1 Tax=Dactylosporangium sp. McL0621 TaxID=3415678 RepID=UPI003CFA7217
MKIVLRPAVPASARRLARLLLPGRTQSSTTAPSRRTGEAGPATGERRPQPHQSGPAVTMSRRALMRTVGAAGGLAVIAGCTPSDGSGTKPSAGQHTHDNGRSGQYNDTHGDGRSASSGRDDPNADLQTLSSEIAMPAQFRAALPIPARLPPARSTSDTDYYEIVQSPATAEIVPGLRTPIMGYNGTFPGPTIVQNAGRRVVVTHKNALAVPTVVHLHGGTTPYESDGYPTDFVLPAAAYGTFAAMPAMPGMPAMDDPGAIVSKLQRDYTYPPQPRAGTLWYHDHRMDFTGASVYHGLAGFHIAHDTEEASLPLPQGARDVPLMITDRAFAADGSFRYPALDPTMHTTPGVDQTSTNGVMGDVILVNGAPWPRMEVDTARYRFRPARSPRPPP